MAPRGVWRLVGGSAPRAAKPIVDKNGSPINLPKSARLMTCDGKFGRRDPEVDRKECGLDRSQRRRSWPRFPRAGSSSRRVSVGGSASAANACGSIPPNPRRWPPAVFIAKKLPGAFRYLIVDELHEHKSDSSGQATACGKLISSTRYCLGMTGTLIGGYADHLFRCCSECRLSGSGRRASSGPRLAFTERYGRIERIVTTKESAGELALTTSNRSMRRERSGRSERQAYRTRGDARPVRQAPDRQGDLPGPRGHGDELCPKLREYVGGTLTPRQPARRRC